MQWQRAKNEYTNNNLVKNKQKSNTIKNNSKIKLNISVFFTCRNKQHQIFQGLQLGQEQICFFFHLVNKKQQ